MTYQLTCDRCGQMRDHRYFTEPPELPDGWIDLDGNHVCPECYDKFLGFMRGDEIPELLELKKNNP